MSVILLIQIQEECFLQDMCSVRQNQIRVEKTSRLDIAAHQKYGAVLISTFMITLNGLIMLEEKYSIVMEKYSEQGEIIKEINNSIENIKTRIMMN